MHVADRERLEGVEQNEPLEELAADELDLLLVVGRAERAGDERLRLAAGEDDRAVRTRQDARLRPDRTNLVEAPAVETHTALEDLVAQHFLFEFLEDRFRLDLALDFRFRHRCDQVLEYLIDTVIVLELAAQPHRLAERHVDLLLDLAVEVVPDLLLLDAQLLLAGGALQLLDAGDELLDGGMRGLERADDLRFADFLGARLDHHDAVAAAGDDEIERALLAFSVGRIDHVLAVDHADAHTG